MKNVIIFCIFLTSTCGYAQGYGDSTQYFLGTTIQLIDPNSLGYEFLKDINEKGFSKNNRIYTLKDGFRPDGQIVSKKKFKVEDIINTPEKIGVFKTYLKVVDLDDNQVSYLGYFKMYFPFKVVENEKITYDEYICKIMNGVKDKFDDKITRRSSLPGPAHVISITHPSKDPIYFLSLESYGHTAIAIEKGVILLFEDGSKINFPEAKVEAKVNDKSISSIPYQYKSFIEITRTELSQLADKKLTDYRLYVFPQTVTEHLSVIIRAEAKCLLSK